MKDKQIQEPPTHGADSNWLVDALTAALGDMEGVNNLDESPAGATTLDGKPARVLSLTMNDGSAYVIQVWPITP